MSRGGAERPPWPVVALAAVGLAFFALPFAGLLVKAPWRSVGGLFGDTTVQSALRLSLMTSIIATAVSVALGLPVAWLLARSGLPGTRWLRALCTLSMVLPPVVAGVALFLALGRRGLVGGPLYDHFGIVVPFSSAAVVIAQVFVAMPFFILTVEAAIRSLDPAPEEAASTLGGSSWFVFTRITLPAVRPAMVSGAVLTWARALGEFGATITFAGSFPGTTRTMPLVTYLALETNPDRAVLLAMVLVAISFGVLVSLRGTWLGAIGSQRR